MVIVTEKATNPRNHITDTAAVVEICNVLNKEPYCAHIATRVIANKIQSLQEWEALQALNLLDTCMKHCGVGFHAEVGKFRFLNEMIKLVSPKYLGGQTALAVRQRVLLLMHAWTIEYPRETKIKEAYDMLKKQGVVKEDPPYVSSGANSKEKDVSIISPPTRPRSSIFEDDERSRLLQKLLQSKNPDDLQAANRLIKTMVKEDEYRVEMNSRRVTELESVHNNVRLLSEMLDQYYLGQTSAEESELIKELHQSCERLRPSVFRLAAETQDNEAMLNEVLSASDELGQVFDKYTAIIVQGKRPPLPNVTSGSTSLLDLSTPSEEKLPPVPAELLSNQLMDLGLDPASKHSAPSLSNIGTTRDKQSDLETLGDIFGSLAPSKSPVPSASSIGVTSILQPVTIQQNSCKSETSPIAGEPEKPSKLKALEDLDALGKSLLKQSLPTSCKLGSQFAKPAVKVPMNLLSKPLPEGNQDESSADTHSLPVSLGVTPSGNNIVASSLDLDFLIGQDVKTGSNEMTGGPGRGGGGGSDSGGGSLGRSSATSDLLNASLVNGSGSDDCMVDISEVAGVETGASGPGSINEQSSQLTGASPSAATRHGTEAEIVNKQVSGTSSSSAAVSNGGTSTVRSPARKVEVKPLTDISVPLENIRPGSLPPLTVLDEKSGITVILNFGKDSPRPDVSVIVVTTISKNSSPISNYLFQAVVPKTCKLRLQPPSGSDLPAHKPFLPPSAITQVLLIANPNKVSALCPSILLQ
ncbi:ADP-ribosylation factor-binding protein GGA1 isoform X2 [Zootermopsis nevadensis]|uniref:ADP-ribosylation factor-binding protein GGA1 isoform X2 n=1 Tax=Zootermopsis nevadensis TaxID=136037 RepID=UPI000B8E955A|nr:ADP-ribosylation factor-binding protein GGA1 isoform X2 [Zootermopsis nevadensis]